MYILRQYYSFVVQKYFQSQNWENNFLVGEFCVPMSAQVNTVVNVCECLYLKLGINNCLINFYLRNEKHGKSA